MHMIGGILNHEIALQWLGIVFVSLGLLGAALWAKVTLRI